MTNKVCFSVIVFLSLSCNCIPSDAMGLCKFQLFLHSIKSKASNLSTTDKQQVTTPDQTSANSVGVQRTAVETSVTHSPRETVASNTSSISSYQSTMMASVNADYTTKAESGFYATSKTFSSTTMNCPDKMEAGSCASTCQATCQDPSGCHGNCTKYPDCVCPIGLFLQEEKCVTQDACDCFSAEKGVLIPEGGIYVSPVCDEICSCIEGNIACNKSYKCDAQATCDEGNAGRGCYCNEGYAGNGQVCTKLVDCYQLLQSGETNSGIYTIFPVNWSKTALNVSCDMMTDGGGWTVLQKRFDQSENFSRDWEDYKNGFGDISGEFWLGNEAIHVITEASGYTLRVELTTNSGVEGYAVYENFRVASESSFYTLHVSGYDSHSTAGDSLSRHNEMKFSTFDMDNDVIASLHCAKMFNGGWWYSQCMFADLNSNTDATWQLNYFNDRINKTQLKIRPEGV